MLQPARLPKDGTAIPFVSDYFDFSVYIDADEHDLQRWYVSRFLRLREAREGRGGLQRRARKRGRAAGQPPEGQRVRQVPAARLASKHALR